LAIEPGTHLAYFQLVEKIGEGGMGVVWKATDTTLDRKVAIKVLPDALAGDAERLARFEREAKLLASLNHPRIASLYGLHATDGGRFLSMELIEGKDLADVLTSGPFRIERALRIALQIAEGLEVAHARGVVHRDLKPANVKLTADGDVKLLDFGLAKALQGPEQSPDVDLSRSPTVTVATQVGVILGTAAYMSPEQSRGHETDRRATAPSMHARCPTASRASWSASRTGKHCPRRHPPACGGCCGAAWKRIRGDACTTWRTRASSSRTCSPVTSRTQRPMRRTRHRAPRSCSASQPG
jgi:serine/threonine protein kinase